MRSPAGTGVRCQVQARVSAPQRYSRGPGLIFRLGSPAEEWAGVGRQVEDALCSCEGPGCGPVAGPGVRQASWMRQ